LIDVPALFDALDHIFDRLPSAMKADGFQEWKRDTFATIAGACKQNHGTRFDKYIEKVIAHRPKLTNYVSRRVDHFVKHVRDNSDGDIARDVAQKFGLIYAGGRLGIRYGLLPWQQSDLLDAISKCYFGARELLPDDGVALRRGIKALKAVLNRCRGPNGWPELPTRTLMASLTLDQPQDATSLDARRSIKLSLASMNASLF
jgi:hypothetical protein